MESASIPNDHDDTAAPLDPEKPKAWEMIEVGRFKPRRTRGSFLATDLG